MSCVWELLTSLLTTLLLELIVLSYYILWWRSGATGLQREGVEPVSRTKQKPLFNYLPYFSNQTDPKIFIRTAPNPEKYKQTQLQEKNYSYQHQKKNLLARNLHISGKISQVPDFKKQTFSDLCAQAILSTAEQTFPKFHKNIFANRSEKHFRAAKQNYLLTLIRQKDANNTPRTFHFSTAH